ncbi:MAG TPA: twin-arginine translocase subunit TatC [Microbacterium sp.]|uniref:twin-arginine translocase subunit TatC n=1 Tax=Microbacterium sp. TaxID=51671 RepID=UPI002C96CE39|nr:twin-arginine translocase subunit TatC [Microbacterium sp.]HWI31394.1 twin-arginine translocase subunit TatC [Microbacterium sp.]
MDAPIPLKKHLVELRRRLVIAAAAIAAGTVVGFVLTDLLWHVLAQPVAATDTAARAAMINFTTVSGAFDLRLQIAFTSGVVMSSPVWLYQIFAFIVPGLRRRERLYALGFVGAAFPLFLLGGAAGWLVVPHMVDLMLGFVPDGNSALLDARNYIDFVLKLILITGVAFVVPVLMVFLNFVGVVSGRSLLAGWRWAVLAIAAFTAIATPAADVLSMFLLAIPMVLLYVAACGVALIHDRRASARLELLVDGPPVTRI